MSPVAPRRLAHRGVVDAAAFVVDARVLGEDAARRRVLSLWTPATRVRVLEHGYLVLLPTKVRTACATAPGTPLVPSGDLLLAAPLEADELRALAPSPRSAVLVEAGVASAVHVDSRPELDPAAWIDLSAWSIARTESLGEPPPPPKVAVAEPERELRKLMEGKVPPRSAKAEEVLAAIREQYGVKDVTPARPGPLATAVARVLRTMARWLTAPAPVSTSSAPARGSTREAVPARSQPSWLSKAAHWLESLAARLAMLAEPLARAIGRKHAEYLAKMMESFERGDWDAALRHAIPLGRGDTGPSGLALGIPGPRDSLALSPFPRSSGGLASPFSGPRLYEHLRALYRRAFERLRDAGRIDEAAFVLAELLGADEEAVSFLETHGREKLAAQMAEARGLPPGLVVRQWLVAGDAERALAIALKTGAFADACQRLQRTHTDLAVTLRLQWGNTLAMAGDFSAAVEAVMPVPSARRLALEWADRGIEAGGAAGARLLARRLELDPQGFARVRDRALKLCDDESVEELRSRAALGRALLEGTSTSAVQALARAVSRALLRDQAAHGGVELPDMVRRLADASGDRALVADLAASRPSKPRPLATREPPLVLDVQAWDSGPSKLFDAAMLPGGQALVALGEGGVRLVGRDGKAIAHFDQPAHELVISDSGLSALALARRGEVQRIAKIDLATRRAKHWQDLRLARWARDFDGAVWWVGSGEKLSVIDVQSAQPRELWQVDRMGGGAIDIARTPAAVSVLLNADPNEAWTYELPGYVLRRRARLEPMHGPWRGVSALGLDARVQMEDGLFLVVAGAGGGGRRPVSIGGHGPTSGAVTERLVACAMPSEAGRVVDVLDTHRVLPRASLNLRGAASAAVRLQEPWLLACDDRGRLVVLDTERGEIVRDLRL